MYTGEQIFKPEYVARNLTGATKDDPVKFDLVCTGMLLLHGAIIAYVGSGWMVSSRLAIFVYLLALPLIVLQWLLNSGTSLINNAENLARSGQWHNPRNGYEGAFFRTLLFRMGIRATSTQIGMVLCAIMLTFWSVALFRMAVVVALPVVTGS